MRRRFGAEVTWLPFDLHPEYPPDGIPRAQLHARYGERFHRGVEDRFAAAGLAYNPPPEVVPNSRASLRVTELARDKGLHEQVHDRLMDAYWTEAQNIGDGETLRAIVVEAGLEAGAVDEVLTGDAFLDRVAASTEQAASIGITGIPGWVLDSRLLILGAQPAQVFDQAFERLGIEPLPGPTSQ